ncbi:hypothetical protein TWF730_010169 [Orbilia blumenaviensis]|uniref:C2H2-type domain-containing protein n=1 Tax=Orbilia blumenaviensis TaxID=1796055 RepID=A0AAV9UMY1_9PEZI
MGTSTNTTASQNEQSAPPSTPEIGVPPNNDSSRSLLHPQNEPLVSQSDFSPSKRNGRVVYDCKICPAGTFKTFSTRTYGQHMWETHNMKVFPCGEGCDYSAARIDNIVVHQKSCKKRLHNQESEDSEEIPKSKRPKKRVSMKGTQNSRPNAETLITTLNIISRSSAPPTTSRDSEQYEGSTPTGSNCTTEHNSERTDITLSSDSSEVLELLRKIATLERENNILKEQDLDKRKKLEETQRELEGTQKELEETRAKLKGTECERDYWKGRLYEKRLEKR